jgi:hypothetical protein
MLSAYWINAHISKPALRRRPNFAPLAERAESYDLTVEFQTSRSVELAIFIIRGCTPSAQYNRCELPRDDTGRA